MNERIAKFWLVSFRFFPFESFGGNRNLGEKGRSMFVLWLANYFKALSVCLFRFFPFESFSGNRNLGGKWRRKVYVCFRSRNHTLNAVTYRPRSDFNKWSP